MSESLSLNRIAANADIDLTAARSPEGPSAATAPAMRNLARRQAKEGSGAQARDEKEPDEDKELVYGDENETDPWKAFWSGAKTGAVQGAAVVGDNFVSLIPFASAVGLDHPLRDKLHFYNDHGIGIRQSNILSKIGLTVGALAMGGEGVAAEAEGAGAKLLSEATNLAIKKGPELLLQGVTNAGINMALRLAGRNPEDGAKAKEKENPFDITTIFGDFVEGAEGAAAAPQQEKYLGGALRKLGMEEKSKLYRILVKPDEMVQESVETWFKNLADSKGFQTVKNKLSDDFSDLRKVLQKIPGEKNVENKMMKTFNEEKEAILKEVTEFTAKHDISVEELIDEVKTGFYGGITDNAIRLGMRSLLRNASSLAQPAFGVLHSVEQLGQSAAHEVLTSNLYRRAQHFVVEHLHPETSDTTTATLALQARYHQALQNPNDTAAKLNFYNARIAQEGQFAMDAGRAGNDEEAQSHLRTRRNLVDRRNVLAQAAHSASLPVASAHRSVARAAKSVLSRNLPTSQNPDDIEAKLSYYNARIDQEGQFARDEQSAGNDEQARSHLRTRQNLIDRRNALLQSIRPVAPPAPRIPPLPIDYAAAAHERQLSIAFRHGAELGMTPQQISDFLMNTTGITMEQYLRLHRDPGTGGPTGIVDNTPIAVPSDPRPRPQPLASVLPVMAACQGAADMVLDARTNMAPAALAKLAAFIRDFPILRSPDFPFPDLPKRSASPFPASRGEAPPLSRAPRPEFNVRLRNSRTTLPDGRIQVNFHADPLIIEDPLQAALSAFGQ